MNMKLLAWLFVFLHTTLTTSAYDYLKLSERWPPTYCLSHNCVQIPTKFTLHGLWPGNIATRDPAFCDKKTAKFVQSLLDDNLKRDLRRDMPALAGNEENFWSHEWLKHGTCSSLGQVAYFKRTLEIYSMNDIKESLHRNDIFTTVKKCYPEAEVIQAISEAIAGKTPELLCTDGNLAEVRICFNNNIANPQYRSCPTYKPTCGQFISFP